jgi:hypothetical protein
MIKTAVEQLFCNLDWMVLKNCSDQSNSILKMCVEKQYEQMKMYVEFVLLCKEEGKGDYILEPKDFFVLINKI